VKRDLAVDRAGDEIVIDNDRFREARVEGFEGMDIVRVHPVLGCYQTAI